MRFLTGFILGALLTIVGVYIVDLQAEGEQPQRMVNWDVVGERVNGLTAGAQAMWADFTSEMTGPP